MGIYVKMCPSQDEIDQMIEKHVQQGWIRDDCATGRGVLSPDKSFWKGWDKDGHSYYISMDWILNLTTSKEKDCG